VNTFADMVAMSRPQRLASLRAVLPRLDDDTLKAAWRDLEVWLREYTNPGGGLAAPIRQIMDAIAEELMLRNVSRSARPAASLKEFSKLLES
jgi:hypothetical protein